MSDTSKFDNLVRRLRARVERSASREQSLDWKAADAIDRLQAECARLAAEARSLQSKSAEAERHAATAPAQPPADVGVPEPHAASTAPALGLQEAADLLNVSYSTVFANRRALGFFPGWAPVAYMAGNASGGTGAANEETELQRTWYRSAPAG